MVQLVSFSLPVVLLTSTWPYISLPNDCVHCPAFFDWSALAADCSTKSFISRYDFRSPIKMTSTETRCGLTCSTRPSSRVLKPPGGGHSNIFSEPEIAVNAPRPKYNQQNSSNMNACMNSTDPNQKVEKLREEITHNKQAQPEADIQTVNTGAATTPTGGQANNQSGTNEQPSRTRVPPGGFSSGGFW